MTTTTTPSAVAAPAPPADHDHPLLKKKMWVKERLIVNHTTSHKNGGAEAAHIERLTRASKACALQCADLEERRTLLGATGPGCVQGIMPVVWLRDALRANTRRALVMAHALEHAKHAPQPEPCRESDDDEVAGAREDAWEVHHAARRAAQARSLRLLRHLRADALREEMPHMHVLRRAAFALVGLNACLRSDAEAVRRGAEARGYHVALERRRRRTATSPTSAHWRARPSRASPTSCAPRRSTYSRPRGASFGIAAVLLLLLLRPPRRRV
jgi:hypothetical protein